MIIKNKKAEFGWKSFMIGMLFFSAVFSLFYFYANDMNTTYDANIIDPQYSAGFDRFTETQTDIEEMYGEVKAGDAFTFLGVANIVLRSFTGAIQIGFGAITDFNNILINFGTIYGVPQEVSTILIFSIYGAVVIALVFVIINAIATRGAGKL